MRRRTHRAHLQETCECAVLGQSQAIVGEFSVDSSAALVFSINRNRAHVIAFPSLSLSRAISLAAESTPAAHAHPGHTAMLALVYARRRPRTLAPGKLEPVTTCLPPTHLVTAGSGVWRSSKRRSCFAIRGSITHKLRYCKW
mgnify:FL=1